MRIDPRIAAITTNPGGTSSAQFRDVLSLPYIAIGKWKRAIAETAFTLGVEAKLEHMGWNKYALTVSGPWGQVKAFEGWLEQAGKEWNS